MNLHLALIQHRVASAEDHAVFSSASAPSSFERNSERMQAHNFRKGGNILGYIAASSDRR